MNQVKLYTLNFPVKNGSCCWYMWWLEFHFINLLQYQTWHMSAAEDKTVYLNMRESSLPYAFDKLNLLFAEGDLLIIVLIIYCPPLILVFDSSLKLTLVSFRQFLCFSVIPYVLFLLIPLEWHFPNCKASANVDSCAKHSLKNIMLGCQFLMHWDMTVIHMSMPYDLDIWEDVISSLCIFECWSLDCSMLSYGYQIIMVPTSGVCCNINTIPSLLNT